MSILHGLISVDANKPQSPLMCEAILSFTKQMFEYMEVMIRSTHLTFPTELLKSLFELYIDLVTIYSDSLENSKFLSAADKITNGPRREEV